MNAIDEILGDVDKLPYAKRRERGATIIGKKKKSSWLHFEISEDLLVMSLSSVVFMYLFYSLKTSNLLVSTETYNTSKYLQ